jgi:hypothetical protein
VPDAGDAHDLGAGEGDVPLISSAVVAVRHICLRLGLVLAIAGPCFLAMPALAQVAPNCVELCDVVCIKPFSIPDRWDDATAITGYTGGGKKPNWQNNNNCDSETLTSDVNGNGLYDPGDGYVDSNGNAMFDAEAYDPSVTGYSAGPDAGNGNASAGDLGLELTLKANNSSKPAPARYYAIDLPPVNRGTAIPGGDAFRQNLATCNPSAVGFGDVLQMETGNMVGPANQGMRDLIAQDPNAYWDSITRAIQGSAFPLSPRIFFLTAHDPRLPIASGTSTLTVRRVLAIFMEQMAGNAEVRGRLLRVSYPGLGSPCGGQPAIGGFFLACATPATPTTWGRVKGIYRAAPTRPGASSKCRPTRPGTG